MPGGFQEQVGGLGSSEDLEQRGLAFPWSIMRATEDPEQEMMRFNFNFNMVKGWSWETNQSLAGAQTEVVGAVEVGRNGQVLDDI